MAGIVHGGGLTAAMRLYGGAREDWLDLSTGINPNMPTLPNIPAEVWHRLPDQSLVGEACAAARDFYLAVSPRGLPLPGLQAHDVHADETDCLPLAVPGTQAFIQMLPRMVPSGRKVAIL
eukprot:gene44143-59775_t